MESCREVNLISMHCSTANRLTLLPSKPETPSSGVMLLLQYLDSILDSILPHFQTQVGQKYHAPRGILSFRCLET